MLIVIVIIGILAAALIPRLSSARGRANDVARKADLAQVAAALVSFQIDHGSFPSAAWPLTNISGNLISAGMSSIPEDPNSSRTFSWIYNGNTLITIPSGQYGYTSIKKWSIPNNGFVLMAWSETEWGANRVSAWDVWKINSESSYEELHVCKTFTAGATPAAADGNGNCTYVKTADQLRYIYLY